MAILKMILSTAILTNPTGTQKAGLSASRMLKAKKNNNLMITDIELNNSATITEYRCSS